MAKQEGRHPGDSAEQRMAERVILKAVERIVRCNLTKKRLTEPRIELDGFCDGPTPVCVEAWARQGHPKGSQPAKVMKDMCKLLLVEKSLGRSCRKIFAVSCREAIRFAHGSRWEAEFARTFGIEIMVVSIDESVCLAVRMAQGRQYR